ncbi:MAG: hypothetical protein EBX39_14545, partial [Actinobacteria bacterium]|nr:hypothetical protein [Actinomycetota bacterium]
HGLGQDEQLIMHALSLAQASLFDLASMPESYIEGELLLPLHLRGGRFLVHLVAKMYGRATAYDPRVMREELGFAQAVLRATDAYDQECHEVIVASYGQRFGSVTGYGELVAEGMARLAVRDAAL